MRQTTLPPMPENAKATGRTLIRKLQRNDFCGCGSGLKFKHCCIKEKGKGTRVQRTYYQKV